MSGKPSRGALLDRVTTVNEHGQRQLAPFVLPLLVLVVLIVALLLVLGRCATNTVTSITKQPEQRPLATPSFELAAPQGCGEVPDTVIQALEQELKSPRLQVARAYTNERDDGVLALGATIQQDNHAIEAVAAIFAVDDTGKLFALSSHARELSRLPDGRKVLRMTPVDYEAQVVNSCLRDQ